jgi:hypothetical protein
MLGAMLADHPCRSLPDLRDYFLGRALRSILSRIEPSSETGTLHA